MKVLLAEDEASSRRPLEILLTHAGYDVVATADGRAAWEILRQEDRPRLAVLDWMIPGIDGAEICRRLRAGNGGYVYVLLLTARVRPEDVAEGFAAGADDYLTKPFDPLELRSRLKVGERILALESALAGKIRELEEAAAHVRQLQGLLPICMHCKKIRTDRNSWQMLDAYVAEHADVTFSHSLCEECRARYYPDRRQKAG